MNRTTKTTAMMSLFIALALAAACGPPGPTPSPDAPPPPPRRGPDAISVVGGGATLRSAKYRLDVQIGEALLPRPISADDTRLVPHNAVEP